MHTHRHAHTKFRRCTVFLCKKKERAKFKNTTLIQEPHFRGIRNGQCSTIMKLYSEKKCFFRTERIFFPASLLNSASDARRPSFVLEESVYRSGSESVHYSCCFCTHCCCPISMQGMGKQNQALSDQCPAYAFDLSQELLFFLISLSDRTFVKFTFDLVAGIIPNLFFTDMYLSMPFF